MTVAVGAAVPPETVGVLICSFKRPDSLLRCLAALRKQQRPADQVVVVVQAVDTATLATLDARVDDGLPIRRVLVDRPGTVHALNAGLAASTSDVVAITDDDTAAWPEWLSLILEHFRANPRLGGLGGRDWVHAESGRQEGRAEPVGLLQWFGRVIGNHHLGFGPPRPVHVLKGANMSYRAAAVRSIRFDTRLRGTGAQPAEDLSFSLRVKRAGWDLTYDPAVATEHFSGEREEPRHYAGIVRALDAEGLAIFAHNETVAILSGLPTLSRRTAYVLFSMLVGAKVSPGLLQALLLSRQFGLLSWKRFGAIQRGRWAGLMTVLRTPLP